MRLTDRIEVLSAGALSEDAYGNPTMDWDNAEVKVEPALVSPVSTSENLSAQDTVTTRWRAILLAFSVADARARIRWHGAVYEVDGDVELHTDTRSRPHHKEALLVKVSS